MTESSQTEPKKTNAEGYSRLPQSNRRITLEEQVALAVDRLPLDDVEFIVTPALVPNQNTEPVPVFGITVSIPALEPGQHLHTSAVISGLWSEQEDLNVLVMRMGKGLWEMRKAEVASVTPPGVDPATVPLP